MRAQLCIGIVLLAASTLKIYDNANGAKFEISHEFSQGFVLTTSLMEASLGIWLMVGYAPVVARQIAAVVFSLFAGWSLSLGVAGAESCGCFGKLNLNPWVMLVFDGAIVAILFFLHPVASGASSGNHTHGSFLLSLKIIVGFVVGILIAAASREWNLNGDERMQFYEPRELVGRRFDLMDFARGSKPLETGRWVLVFYRSRCEICERHSRQFSMLAKTMENQQSNIRLALIEIPSDSQENFMDKLDLRSALRLRINTTKNLLIATPQVMYLEDGIIESDANCDSWPLSEVARTALVSIRGDVR